MAIDVGHVRIGVALSDPMGIIASPHDVIQATSSESDAQAVADMAEATGAVRIVVGLPLDQDGEVGPQAQKVLDFIDILKSKTDREIFPQDERFTSAFAERSLIGMYVSRKGRKKVIDKIAAQQILQSWMDRAAHDRKRGEA